MTQGTTLAAQTQQAMAEFMDSLGEGTRQTIIQAMGRLLQSGAGANAKLVGDTAPDFALPAVGGQTVSLSSLLGTGPVVLNFYRGGWCPFCNLEFRALQAKLPEMKALGATLVGISPETPDNSLDTKTKHALEFEVLSDVGNQVAGEYGLVCVVDEAVRPLYLEWGIDVPAVNGDDSYSLPIPATYVIDTMGVIQAAYVDKDYTRRMEPMAIVEALRDLQG